MILVRTALLAALLLAVDLVPLAAQARRPPPNLGETAVVEFELRRWRSDLDSELRLSGGGVPGSTLDPLTDLGLPVQRSWDYHFRVRLMRRLRARGNWLRIQYEGTATPGRELCLAGLCTAPGNELSSRLELEQIRVGAELDLVRGIYGSLAVLGEYGRMEMGTGFDSVAGSVTPAVQRIELPLVGVKGRLYLTPAIAITVEGAGMKKESEGVMTDFDAAVTYNLIPNVAFSYGYRNAYHRFKALEPDGDRAVVRLRGQYFGVTVRF